MEMRRCFTAVFTALHTGEEVRERQEVEGRRRKCNGMLRTAEKTVDDRWNRPKVSTVCSLAKAKELPQQPQMQHNTDARKHSDMLNWGIQRFWIMNKKQQRLTIALKHY